MSTPHREELGNGVFALTEGAFTFGQEALLLADFALRCAPRATRAADLCAGCGIVSLLWARTPAPRQIDAVELLPQGAQLCERAVRENNLCGRIAVHSGDLRAAALPAGQFDLAACNPPFFKPGAGAAAQGEARRIARAEETLSLPELFAAAARLLKNGGRFCLCHRIERMATVMHELICAGLTPKILEPVRTAPAREPKLFLLCAVRGGGEGLCLHTDRL